MVCLGCQWKLKPSDESASKPSVQIERYDKLETHFLTTGDYAVMQQMNTDYPVQTRMLIENVLRLGQMDDADIKSKFYDFYQDSTLQRLLADVDMQFQDMKDINKELNKAFHRLHEMLPHLAFPVVYSQVTALDQSIVVGDGLLGISLDKYLGVNHPLYLKYGYTESQRQMMKPEYIVPDCIAFYLLSIYQDDYRHSKKPVIQYVVNRVVGRKVFDDEQVAAVERYLSSHPDLSVDALLKDTPYGL